MSCEMSIHRRAMIISNLSRCTMNIRDNQFIDVDDDDDHNDDDQLSMCMKKHTFEVTLIRQKQHLYV